MPRHAPAVGFALVGALLLASPAGFALAIEDVTGVWDVRSIYVFGQMFGSEATDDVDGLPRMRFTIAVSNGVPLCLFQMGKSDPTAITIEQWESRGAEQATVRITQLAPAGEVATYAVERSQPREIRLTATSGTNTGKCVILAKSSLARPRPAQPGQDAGERPAARSAAKEAASAQISRLTNELNIETKKLANAKLNLKNQLMHTEGAAGGRRAEYDAVVAEREADVRLHRKRIDEICEKLDELGADTDITGKVRKQ